MLAKFIDRPREDSLTAAVFSILLHLPSEDLWSILRSACSSGAFPKYPGEPLAIHAWPNWSAAATRNSTRVIPDLVIEFASFNLIIEAKRWDRPMQDREQWRAELQAYVNEYGRKHPVKMIALGGAHSHHDYPLHVDLPPDPATGEEASTIVCPVHMCQWSGLLLACRRQKRRLAQRTLRDSRTHADERILNDLITMFIHHNFKPIWWFEDFDFRPNLLSDRWDSDRQFFQNVSRCFHQTA